MLKFFIDNKDEYCFVILENHSFDNNGRVERLMFLKNDGSLSLVNKFFQGREFLDSEVNEIFVIKKNSKSNYRLKLYDNNIVTLSEMELKLHLENLINEETGHLYLEESKEIVNKLVSFIDEKGK